METYPLSAASQLSLPLNRRAIAYGYSRFLFRHSGAAQLNPESRPARSRFWIPGPRFTRPGMTNEKLQEINLLFLMHYFCGAYEKEILDRHAGPLWPVSPMFHKIQIECMAPSETLALKTGVATEVCGLRVG